MSDETSGSSVVDLSSYPAESVHSTIEFIYTGQLNLNRADPCTILALANHCQIGALQSILANVAPASAEQLRLLEL